MKLYAIAIAIDVIAIAAFCVVWGVVLGSDATVSVDRGDQGERQRTCSPPGTQETCLFLHPQSVGVTAC